MIIPLPSETEQSYFDGVKFLMDNEVQTRTYTLYDAMWRRTREG